jgi:predicted DNA-binding transcriptional regulator AlpA
MDTTNSIDPLRDEDHLCERAQISPKTAQKWRQTGRGPSFVKVGRLVRYRESAIQAWLDQQTRSNTAQHARPRAV